MIHSHLKIITKTAADLFRKKGSVMFLAILAIIFFGFSNICSAYATPDWEAQKRANERQKPHTKQVTVDWKQERKNNKKQQVKGQKTSQLSDKKRTARQKPKGKPYKYDRQAELRRNARQEVK